jgi:hypothetical protein
VTFCRHAKHARSHSAAAAAKWQYKKASLARATAAVLMSALKEVLPKFGLVYSDRGNLAEIMSKPKLIPIKVSVALHCAM